MPEPELHQHDEDELEHEHHLAEQGGSNVVIRNTFTDPRTAAAYTWPLNHESEDAFGRTRTIGGSANTGLTGRVRQQSDDGPLVHKLHGRILHRDMLRQFWYWFNLCKTQTIYFRDFDDQEYEVQIISFQPKRVRKAKTASPDPNMRPFYIEYDLEMEVYGVRHGDLADLGVSA